VPGPGDRDLRGARGRPGQQHAGRAGERLIYRCHFPSVLRHVPPRHCSL
jgi:hypothetical protein